jgi:hypothetical protein
MERKGEHAREITPIKRETPSSGHQSGLLREVFSNFGKISTKEHIQNRNTLSYFSEEGDSQYLLEALAKAS